MACLLVFLTGISTEALAFWRTSRRPGHLAQNMGVSDDTSASLLALASSIAYPHNRRLRRLVHSASYALQIASGYLLMLAAMTFNVGIFLSTILGLAAGYFLFLADGEEATTPPHDASAECHGGR